MNYQQSRLFQVSNRIEQAKIDLFSIIFFLENKFITLMSLIVPFGYFSVSLCVIATTLTPILQRIPNEIRKPNELRNAVWYRTGIVFIEFIIRKRDGIYFDDVLGIVFIRRRDIPSSSSTNSA